MDQAPGADALFLLFAPNDYLLCAGEHGQDQLNALHGRMLLTGELDP